MLSLQGLTTVRREWSAINVLYLISVGVFLLAGYVRGQDPSPFSPSLFYDPLQNPAECKNYLGQPSLICDPGEVLDPALVEQLQAELSAIRNHNSCPCQDACTSSYTVAIAVVPYRAAPPDVDPETAVQQLGEALVNSRWAAHGRCGENVVIVFSPRHRIVYTAVGRKAQGRLEDRCRANLEDRARGLLNKNRQLQALETVISEYRQYLSGDKSCDLPLQTSTLDGIYITIIVLGIIILLGLTYCFIVLFKRCFGSPKPRTPANPIPADRTGPGRNSNVFDVPYGRSFGGGAVVVGGLKDTGSSPGALTSAPDRTDLGRQQSSNVFDVPYGRSFGGGAVVVDGIKDTGSSLGSPEYGPLPSANISTPMALAHPVSTPIASAQMQPGIFGNRSVQEPQYRQGSFDRGDMLTVGGGDGGGALGFDGF